MIKLSAKLKFFDQKSGRTSPIVNGYRPQFKFGNSYVSGAISIDDKLSIKPGEEILAEVFIFSEYLTGNISKGQIITFWEPPVLIGEIEVLSVVLVE